MDICHLKNAELARHLQKSRERVVLQDDNVKDEEGYNAIFTEQGASASDMAAAKFSDTILVNYVNETMNYIQFLHVRFSCR